MKIVSGRAGRKAWHTDEYLDYLESETWATVRAAALKRAGHRCEWVSEWNEIVADHGDTVDTEIRTEACAETEGLEVHHRSYDRLGHEKPGDLEVLCRHHHGIADRERRRARRKKR